ncbi:cytochrome p450 domain-containing protein [Trichoderma breve]|uniref:Cytochrome p450 domain-containing protein n=1 Tax=Trichoderma breve TaxID=2034170 RepID=A0A9W9B380_9HYPO|nr:cytochrome p450 domain-containing protein [Trichoderma breve]KAJ4854474.1 cytochrome p450 domain-containing protein [Trichoderma breve]
MADSIVRDAFASIRGQDAPLSATSYLVLLAALFVASTWVYSRFQKNEPKDDFPPWVPLEIGVSSALIQVGGTVSNIFSLLSRGKGSLFGLTSRHQILHNLDNIDRVFTKGPHILSADVLGLRLGIRVFGANLTQDVCQKFMAINRKLTQIIERYFVNEASATASIQAAHIPEKVAQLLSFSSDAKRQHQWERCASIRVISDDSKGQPDTVEADLELLMRDFGACVSIPRLYGQDFLDRNHNLLEDFWKFDNNAFPLLVIGVPTWAPIKSFKEALAARTRLHDALEGFYNRINQYKRGLAVDFDADMSDHDVPMRARAELELGTFWGLNANMQPMVFWLLLYIHSTPGLLQELREEVSSCISLSTAANPPQITALVEEPTSIRYVSKPLTVPDGNLEHHFKPGTWLSAPHALLQSDPSIFPEPDKFIPDRFIETDKETGARVARYGKLKPWGSGSGVCKGRTFAEKEVMGIVACFITLWDMDNAEGSWKLPSMIPGTGVKRPQKAIRVVIKRRNFV